MKDLAGWLDSFAVPLVAGGTVRVRGPVARRDYRALSHFEHTPLADARAQVADALSLHVPTPELDPGSVALLGAVGNLLFLAHPDAHAPRVSESARTRVAALAIAELGALLPPADGAELIARHTIVHRLAELGRNDVDVRYWAGSAEFRGVEPPARLSRWGKVRRVHHDRRRVLVLNELCMPAEGPARAVTNSLVRAIYRASPLTALLRPGSLTPPMALADTVRWLAHAKIARLVVDEYLEAGLHVAGPAWLGPGGLPSLCEAQRPDAALVRLACAFLCHLQLLDLLRTASAGRSNAGEGDAQRLRLEGLVQRHDGLRDFFGLFAVCAERGMERPPDMRSAANSPNDDLNDLVDRHVRLCRALVGGARLQELGAMIDRGLGRPPKSDQKSETTPEPASDEKAAS